MSEKNHGVEEKVIIEILVYVKKEMKVLISKETAVCGSDDYIILFSLFGTVPVDQEIFGEPLYHDMRIVKAGMKMIVVGILLYSYFVHDNSVSLLNEVKSTRVS